MTTWESFTSQDLYVQQILMSDPHFHYAAFQGWMVNGGALIYTYGCIRSEAVESGESFVPLLSIP